MSAVKTSRRRQNSPRNSSSGSAVSSTRVLLCSDGSTRVLYEVLGGGGGGSGGRGNRRSNANANTNATATTTTTTTTTVFVVCHDLFDCLDATKLLFLDLVRRHPECRILVYNQPGQAGTTFPVKASGIGTSKSSADNTKQPSPQRTVALNNDFHAGILYQLLCHVRSTGELPIDPAAAAGGRSSSIDLHLIGIGNGVSVLLSLLDKYGSSNLFKLTGSSAVGDGGGGSALGEGSGILKSMISINGYATIDAQLAGILHSAKNAFRSFPANRPDLPISYLSHYMFSDEYIGKVSMDLALSIYTAVLNPISLEGRIRLVDGALKNRSIHHLDKLLERFGIPIIAIQSTDNRIVAPSNVDAFLEGRNALHMQYNNTATTAAGKENDCYDQTGLAEMLDKCFQRDGSDSMQDDSDVVASSGALPPPSSLAMFVRAGHAIVQECKGPILGLLDRLVSMQSFPCVAGESRQVGTTSSTNTLRLSPPPSSTLPTLAKGEGRTRSSKAPQKDEKQRRGGKKFTTSGGDGNGDREDKGKKRKKKNEKKLQESRPDEETNCKSMAPIGKHHGGVPPSKERQTNRDQRKKEREPKSTASSSRRKMTRNSPSASEAFSCGSDGSEWAKEESLQASESPFDSVENGDTTLTTPYIVKGAPCCSLNEIISSTGADADVSLEEKMSSKVPQLQDYLVRGIPTELIPTEIKAGSPTVEQMRHRRWDFSSANPTITIPSSEMTNIATHASPPTVEELELEFYKELEVEREREAQRIESERRKAAREVDHSDVKNEQMKRSLEYQREDKRQLDKLREENVLREKERAQHQLQRRIEIDEMESSLIRSGLVDPYMPAEGGAPPIRSLPPTRFMHLASSTSRIDPCHLATTKLDGILDVLDNDAELAAKKGMLLTVDEFEQIRRKLKQQHLEKEMELRRMTSAERHVLFMRKARDIQRTWRGHQGRIIAAGVLRDKRRKDTVYNAVVLIQKCRRGSVGRIVACEKRDEAIRLARTIAGAGTIQRCWRGCVGRRVARARKQELLAIICQSLYRGHRGRTVARNERRRQERIRLENSSAIKIQCMWRIGIALEQCRLQLIRRIASIDLQRIVRGHIARQKATKVRIWATTEPGPARIELGLRWIKESQDEFERQRDDLDGLHRAQEIAETRVNRMFRTLKESEKELAHLQKELDDLERSDEIQMDGANDKEEEEEVGKNARDGDESKALISSNTDALEREKRRRYLQSEVQDVLSKVNEKRTALTSLETKISDMEATRERKDREFKRMQRDLMELLSDQKDELDELRERGMELETVTATTAVAAAATAQKARDHEIQTNKMFHRQEELMKFQFMSMSLSYMSSLGMLKQMKNMASDATATAVSCSADTAAAAAAAAAAANLPSPSSVGGEDLSSNENLPSHLASRLSMAQTKGKDFAPSTGGEPQGDAGVKESDDTDADEPLPQDCHDWTVGDVSKWLRKLSLGMYAGKFAEASVDGDFLLELKEDDLAGVLGMKHKLHRRKLILAREKLSLSPEEQKSRAAAVRFVDKDVLPTWKRASMSLSSLDQESSLLMTEENHHHHHQQNQQRNRRRLAMPFALGSVPSPAAGVVFSHARHGRLKRLEESLDEGFDIDATDDQGNTLLMTAVQNGNKKAVDMLIRRGSTLNHMNGNGNTALHYALAYDTTGEIATFLIKRGADDTIENRQGLSAYDGLGDDDPGTMAEIEEDDDGEEDEEDLDLDSTVNDSRIEMVVAANI